MGVLADPTEAGDAGEVSFQHRSGIDKGAPFDWLAAQSSNGFEQLLQVAP